jgi:hypothetical protein
VRYFLGTSIFACPRKFLPVWVWDVVNLYASWERGAMPNNGGVLAQPAALVDAMTVIASTLGTLARARAEASKPPPGPTPEGGLRASNPVKFSGHGGR